MASASGLRSEFSFTGWKGKVNAYVGREQGQTGSLIFLLPPPTFRIRGIACRRTWPSSLWNWTPIGSGFGKLKEEIQREVNELQV